MHLLMQPTWRCPNACPYCWVRQTVHTRPALLHATERPPADWIAAIRREQPELVDIAGGEPFAYDGLLDIVAACPDTRFAITTNAALPAVQALAHVSLPNLIGVTVSYHPHSVAVSEATWRAHLLAIRAGGHNVTVNVVDADTVSERAAETVVWLDGIGVRVVVSPEERMADLEREAGPLECDGGVAHLVVAPDGATWPCLTTLRSGAWGETALGNWLDGTLDLGRVPKPCRLYCYDYYVLRTRHVAGDMWNTNARRIR